jgi:hypothetical protein
MIGGKIISRFKFNNKVEEQKDEESSRPCV